MSGDEVKSKRKMASLIQFVLMAVVTICVFDRSNVAAPTLCFALIKPVLEKLPSGSQFSKCLIVRPSRRSFFQLQVQDRC
jgi:hypothetical protein